MPLSSMPFVHPSKEFSRSKNGSFFPRSQGVDAILMSFNPCPILTPDGYQRLKELLQISRHSFPFLCSFSFSQSQVGIRPSLGNFRKWPSEVLKYFASFPNSEWRMRPWLSKRISSSIESMYVRSIATFDFESNFQIVVCKT